MESNRILIVGYKGFIGSNLWDLFTGENWKPKYKRNIIGTDKDGGAKVEDIGSQFTTDSNLVPDVVVLLAANLNQDLEMYQQNLSIYNWAANTFPDAHFIYTSSASVYGIQNEAATEDTETFPHNLYGESKLLGEDIIRATKENYTILRLSNVYGRGDGNGLIDNLLHPVRKVTRYGHGDHVRDYVSVDVVCAAIKKISENPEQYNRETYNISSGIGKTVNSVIKEYGFGQQIYQAPIRDGEVPYSVLNRYKATLDGLV